MYTYTAVQLQAKTFGELKSIARELDIVPSGDRRCRQSWIDAIVGVELPLLALIETSSGVETDLVQERKEISGFKGDRVQERKEISGFKVDRVQERKEISGFKVDRVQQPIAPAVETSPGVTFSDRFLARYSPPQPEIHYQVDAGCQLTLLDFEVVATDEPPDPDDFDCFDDFREAMAAWDAENLEPLEVSLDSMIYWAPCPEEWYWPLAEDVKRCPCGAVFAIACDGSTVTHIAPDRIVFMPCYKQRLADGVAAARSPPGGDVLF
ncbi:hypothetical protein [Microcoleus sp. Pol12A5]|uniref:hypothetical protein n=1 Tax=Microcoleus sp. Pol12A5 TaxID=3055392 RepID=UPI002FD06759